jgi:hypothetical protein
VRASHAVGARPAGDLAGGDVASAHATGGNDGDVTGSEIRGGDRDYASTAGPAGVLISADRYDLAEP